MNNSKIAAGVSNCNCLLSPCIFYTQMYFVTGNDKKWTEIEAILSNSVDIKRSNIDCKNLDIK